MPASELNQTGFHLVVTSDSQHQARVGAVSSKTNSVAWFGPKQNCASGRSDQNPCKCSCLTCPHSPNSPETNVFSRISLTRRVLVTSVPPFPAFRWFSCVPLRNTVPCPRTCTYQETTGESTLPRGTEDDADRRHDEQGKIQRQQEQYPQHDTRGGGVENGTTRTTDGDTLSRVRSPENTSEPASCNRSRKARSVADGGWERRRDVAMGSVVRVPGQERRRPYNSFHRFRKVSGSSITG